MISWMMNDCGAAPQQAAFMTLTVHLIGAIDRAPTVRSPCIPQGAIDTPGPPITL